MTERIHDLSRTVALSAPVSDKRQYGELVVMACHHRARCSTAVWLLQEGFTLNNERFVISGLLGAPLVSLFRVEQGKLQAKFRTAGEIQNSEFD